MTQSIVDCLASMGDPATISSESSNPSLTNPAIGNPIMHSQVLQLTKRQSTFRLEELLRGSQIYVAPPAPKPAKVRTAQISVTDAFFEMELLTQSHSHPSI